MTAAFMCAFCFSLGFWLGWEFQDTNHWEG